MASKGGTTCGEQGRRWHDGDDADSRAEEAPQRATVLDSVAAGGEQRGGSAWEVGVQMTQRWQCGLKGGGVPCELADVQCGREVDAREGGSVVGGGMG